MQPTLEYPTSKTLHLKRFAKILGTGKGLPERIVSNDEIIRKWDLIATDRAIQFAVGIKERRWAEKDETVSALLERAAGEALNRAGVSPEKLDRIIYTRLLGERILPATAVKVAEKLKIRKGVPAFDIAAACSGFIHALDLAIRYIATGDDYVLILGGDITSRSANQTNKKDTKTIFLNGDAVAALVLGVSETKHFLGSYLYTDNTNYHLSFIPFGGEILLQTLNFNNEMFNMQMPDGMLVHNAVVNSCRMVTDKLLEQTGLTLQDIDFIVTSDQTTLTWKAQLEVLGVPLEKSVSLFYKHGNTVAAMSPLNLNELIETGKLQRGMTVMMMAHGAGSSGGGFIFKY